MSGDVRLGKYYPGCSVLHMLDPRTKMFFTLLYIVSVFFASSVVTCLYTSAVLLILILLSEIPVKYFFKGLFPFVCFIVLFSFADVVLFKAELKKTAVLTLRIVEITVCSNLMSLTTKPKDIADGIEQALSFLKTFKVPVHDFATIISIAVRFIPILVEEADRIIEAQKARGADFRHFRTCLAVIIPLFESAFRKADNLSIAMDSRLYGYGQRTRLHRLIFGSYDVLSFILCAEYIAVFVLWRVLCL